MNRQAIKDTLYGGIIEMTQNRRYYYTSGIGTAYSHWTTEGETELLAYIKTMTKLMKEAEATDLDERAKNLVMKGLSE